MRTGSILARFDQMPVFKAFRWPSVNSRSQGVRRLGAVLAVFCVASVARADRIVVLPATGETTPEQLEEIEDHVAGAVRSIAHEAVTDGLVDGPPPQTANEMRAVAEMQQAQWIVRPHVTRVDEGGYWLHLAVGYAPATRVEELDAEVREAREADRLRELLQAMLRPEGISEDGYALGGEDARGRELERANAADAAEQARLEEEERLRREQEEREAAEREAAEQAEREAAEREAAEQAERDAYENRDRYGVSDGLTMVQVGLGVRPLLSTADNGSGGTLGTFELRLGRGFESVPGLELRGGIDAVFGASSAFAVHVGAAYLFSPFTFPLHLGATAEVGLFQSLTGQRSPAFLIRASALLSFNVAGPLYVEASLPEFMVLLGAEALSLGGSVRAGVRF